MKALALVLAFFVIATDSIEAAKTLLPKPSDSALRVYQELNQKERFELFKTVIEERSKEDHETLKEYKDELQEIHWPDIVREGSVVKFITPTKTITIEDMEGDLFRYQGKVYDAGPGKLKVLIESLSAKQVSFMNFVISNAYAAGNDGFFISAFTTLMKAVGYKLYDFRKDCVKLRGLEKKWDSFDQDIQEGLREQTQDRANALTRAYQKNGCDSNKTDEDCIMLKSASACYREMDAKINRDHPLAISSKERSSRKDITPRKGSSSQKKTSSKGH